MKDKVDFTNIIQYLQKKRLDLLLERQEQDICISQKQIEMEDIVNHSNYTEILKTDSIVRLENEIFELITRLDEINAEISQIDTFITNLNSNVQSQKDYNEYNVIPKFYGEPAYKELIDTVTISQPGVYQLLCYWQNYSFGIAGGAAALYLHRCRPKSFL